MISSFLYCINTTERVFDTALVAKLKPIAASCSGSITLFLLEIAYDCNGISSLI